MGTQLPHGRSTAAPHFLALVYRGQMVAISATDRITNTSDPGHSGTSLVGPKFPDRSAMVPKCPKDSSDLCAELSCPKCRTVLPQF